MPYFKLIKRRGNRLYTLAEGEHADGSIFLEKMEQEQQAENAKWLKKMRGAKPRVELIQMIAEGKVLQRKVSVVYETEP